MSLRSITFSGISICCLSLCLFNTNLSATPLNGNHISKKSSDLKAISTEDLGAITINNGFTIANNSNQTEKPKNETKRIAFVITDGVPSNNATTTSPTIASINYKQNVVKNSTITVAIANNRASADATTFTNSVKDVVLTRTNSSVSPQPSRESASITNRQNSRINAIQEPTISSRPVIQSVSVVANRVTN